MPTDFTFLFHTALETKLFFTNTPIYPLCIYRSTSRCSSATEYYGTFFIIPLIIAILWILTYPTLYFITNRQVFSDFEIHFESVFSYYFIAWVTSLLILAHYIPFLALPIVTIISTIKLIMLIIPMAQLVYYMLYVNYINESGMQMIQDTYLNETLEFIKSILQVKIFLVYFHLEHLATIFAKLITNF